MANIRTLYVKYTVMVYIVYNLYNEIVIEIPSDRLLYELYYLLSAAIVTHELGTNKQSLWDYTIVGCVSQFW